MDSKCHFYLFLQHPFHQKASFPACAHFNQAVLTSWLLCRITDNCPAAAPIKEISLLICSRGLQFFFSNAISFSRDGTTPNDPKHLLESFFIFWGSLWMFKTKAALFSVYFRNVLRGKKWLIEKVKAHLIASRTMKEGFINADNIRSLSTLIGTHVHMLIWAISQSANHIAAWRCRVFS